MISVQSFQNGQKSLIRFLCSHSMVIPSKYDKSYLRCPACKIGKSREDNKKSLLEKFPEIEVYLNQEIF